VIEPEEPAVPVRVLRLIVQYAGTRYRGWQLQPGAPTIQGELEAVFTRLLDEPVRVIGAARTDTGVHARGQAAMLRTRSDLSVPRLMAGVNALLPPDIRVAWIEDAPDRFHVHHGVVSKEYRYRIWTGPIVPPWEAGFVAHAGGLRPDGSSPRALDAGLFRDAAARLLGAHDFTGFSCAGSSSVRPLRTITLSELHVDGLLWTWRVASDGFLYKMVRCLAGTLMEIAGGRVPPGRLEEIFEGRVRDKGHPVAPAAGLRLESIVYEDGWGLTSEAPGAASGDRSRAEDGPRA
jgi:tRNA pseudouridine38-40 synthase